MSRRGLVPGVVLVCVIGGAVAPAAAAQRPVGSVSPSAAAAAPPTLSVSDRLADRRFVAAGTRAYDIGTEDGLYPAMGWHIRGEMGGIWTPPLKLLDGVWFGLDGSWLPSASTFTSGFGYERMQIPATDGVAVRRTDFAPDGKRGVLIGLTLTSSATKQVDLAVDAHSELMSAYPWGWTTPDQTTFNLPDTATSASGRLLFREIGTPPTPNATRHEWAAIVGAVGRQPTSVQTGTDFRGPQDPPVICPASGDAPAKCDDTGFGKGAGGELHYAVSLQAGTPQTVWIAVAGSDAGTNDATAQWTSVADNPEAQLTAKIGTRSAYDAMSRISLPQDPQLAQAIQWGKQNLADLTQEATNLQVRATQQGSEYPPPVATIDKIRFEGAGFPDYPWLFATDGEYTAFPLVAAGRFDLVEDHLRALRAVSQAVNGDSGKVAHETVTSGDVYYGLNSDPGDIDETAKFPSAVALVWRWSGDNAFRDEMYGFAKANMHYLLEQTDPDHDMWPNGSGNVESQGLGSEVVDVSVYTIRGLLDLADMARSKHDTATMSWAISNANKMLAKFEKTWWMPSVPQYADSLLEPNDTQVMQRWWIGVTPMEAELYRDRTELFGLAKSEHANAALDLRETSCYTGTWGLYVQGAPGCDSAPPPPITANQTVFPINTAVMDVALANYGRMAEAFHYADLSGQLELRPDEQPGDMPETAPSPSSPRNIDRPLNERSMVEQAWGQYGTLWPVVHLALGVAPDLGNGLLSIVPQVPDGQSTLSGEAIHVGSGSVDVTATHSGSSYGTTADINVTGVRVTVGQVLPAGAEVASVTVNGAPAAYTVRDTNRGREVLVNVTASHVVLQVTTK